jgi:hypothetical protein
MRIVYVCCKNFSIKESKGRYKQILICDIYVSEKDNEMKKKYY